MNGGSVKFFTLKAVVDQIYFRKLSNFPSTKVENDASLFYPFSMCQENNSSRLEATE